MRHRIVDPGRVLEPTLVFGLFVGLYSLTSSQNLSEAHDSISYINSIDHQELFHPHHLLYNWAAAVWTAVWRLFGYGGDSALPVRLLNVLFGSLTNAVFYQILRRRLNQRRLVAWAATLLAGSCYGLWFYSGTIEVYVIPLFFLSLALYTLAGRDLQFSTFALVGVLNGVAVLFHQIHVLFATVTLYALLSNYRSGFHRVKALVYYGLPATIIAAVPYLLVMRFGLRFDTTSAAIDWLVGYADSPQYWAAPGAGALASACIGFSRSFIGGHFVFALPAVSEWVQRTLRDSWLVDEVFLTRNLPIFTARVLLGLSGLFFVLLATTLARGLLRIRATWRLRLPLLDLAGVWFVTYSLFFLFWEPLNVEFWIPQNLAFLLVLVGLSATRTGASGRRRISNGLVLSVLAALLMIVNLWGSMYWLRSSDNDYYAAKTRSLATASAPGDLIVVGRSWIIMSYLNRYTEAGLVSLTDVLEKAGDLDSAAGDVRARMNAVLRAGGKVLVSEDAVVIEPQVLTTYGADVKRLADRLWAGHEWHMAGEEPGRYYVLK